MERSIYHFVKYMCVKKCLLNFPYLYLSQYLNKVSCDFKLFVTHSSQSLNTLQIKTIADQGIPLQNSELFVTLYFYKTCGFGLHFTNMTQSRLYCTAACLLSTLINTMFVLLYFMTFC